MANFLESYGIKPKMASNISDKQPINLFDFSNIKKPSELMAQQTKPTQPSGFSNMPKTNQIRYNDIDLENAQKLKDLGVSQDKIIELVNKKKQQREGVQEQSKPESKIGTLQKVLFPAQAIIGKGLETDFGRGAIDKTKESFTGGLERIQEAGVGMAEGKYNFMESAVRGGAGALQTAFSPLSGIVGETIESGVEKIPEDIRTKIKQEAEPTIEGLKEWYNNQPADQQRRLQNIGVTIELLANFIGVKGIQKATPTIKQGFETTGDILKQGGDKLVDTGKVVVDKTATLGKSIEGKGENFRNAISGLDEREVMALKNTPRQEWEGIINQAKQAKDNDYVQTPYNEGAKKANEAFKTLENNLDVNQTKRIETLQNSGIESIDTTKVRQDIVADIEKTFNIKGATIKDGKVKYQTTPGRESLLDENPRNIEAIKLLENATQSRTPLQMMDNIKKMQNLIYDSNMLNKLGKDMENLITRSIGKLNKSFKEQVGGNYANILDDMAQDIKIKNELVRIFKASSGEEALNRGELAMKRLANGTTTSAEARQLALLVKEKTGIDLIKEARLRQLAMDLVDDKRGTTLFGAIEKGPKGIIGYGLDKARKLTPFDKEKTALARTLKPKKLNNANTTNTNNSTFNTTNKQTNTKNNQNAIALTSKPNDKLLKTPTTPKKIDRQEVKLLKSAKPTQIETNKKLAEGFNKSAKERFTKGDFTQTEIQKGRTKLDSLYEGRKTQAEVKPALLNKSKTNVNNINSSNNSAVLESSKLKNVKSTILSPKKLNINIKESKPLPQTTAPKKLVPQIETKLKNLTKDNIDQISKSFTNDAQKLAKIKVVIQQHIKKYGEQFKDYMAELVDKISDTLGTRMKFMGNDGIGVDKTKLLKGSDDLISEAKKYKSAEEFVKDFNSKKIEIYHGGKGKVLDELTTDFADELSRTNQVELGKLYAEGPGIYFTSSIKEAKGYGGNIVKIKPKQNTNLITEQSPLLTKSKIKNIINDLPKDRVNIAIEDWGNLDEIIDNIYNSGNTIEQIQSIWADVLNNQNNTDFIKAVSKNGIDGIVKKKGDNIHTIIYSKNMFQ